MNIKDVEIRWENAQPFLNAIRSVKSTRRFGCFSDFPMGTDRQQRIWTEKLWRHKGSAPSGFASWPPSRQRKYILKRVRSALKHMEAVAQVWIHVVTTHDSTFVSVTFARNKYPYRTNLGTDIRVGITMPQSDYNTWLVFRSLFPDLTLFSDTCEQNRDTLQDLLEGVLS